MRVLAALVLVVLAACAAPGTQVAKNSPTADLLPDRPLAPSRFPSAAPPLPLRTNAEMAQEFLDLEFNLESGRTLAGFSRFPGPITVRMTGGIPASAPEDLARLLTRLRAEARLDIRQAQPDERPSITIEFLPRAQMQALAPTAACFVVPGVTTWSDYRRERNADAVDWAALKVRDQVAIFVPNDTSPQEVRDCLHEEVAQAVGPLNDLYRLPDSVFNDDNFNTVLTGFDMLMLRLHYAPELPPGLSQAAVRERLPALLARMNPAGERAGPPPGQLEPRDWIEAVETAFGPRASDTRRRAAAARAVEIARAQGWQDTRLAFSYFAVGRLNVGSDVQTAVTAFAEAAQIYRSLPGGAIQAAHIDMQMAAFALSSGQSQLAVALADHAIPVVTQAENAALLATLLLIKAEALEQLNQPAEARAVRLDSLGWARYGFGTDADVRARMAEIAALARTDDRG